ncbi:hypothetical protein SAMN05421858_5067 [Haladaptatus litoreus]|uniref:Uncharacterized protein n=1 Tax=Haladaptatus litoreus TaxID=553468 RepID=A0A1N7FHQ2_9EURY|nr:hypothetical protein [Haladaptatus litoreus]SIR99814.1 hypothetical protein SAMN05421858_5067 [Haladaptatus litoreus]
MTEYTTCPSCESDDTEVGFIADFDVRCNDCKRLFDVRDGELIILPEYENRYDHPLLHGCTSKDHDVLLLDDPIDGAPCPIDGCDGELDDHTDDYAPKEK